MPDWLILGAEVWDPRSGSRAWFGVPSLLPAGSKLELQPCARPGAEEDSEGETAERTPRSGVPRLMPFLAASTSGPASSPVPPTDEPTASEESWCLAVYASSPEHAEGSRQDGASIAPGLPPAVLCMRCEPGAGSGDGTFSLPLTSFPPASCSEYDVQLPGPPAAISLWLEQGAEWARLHLHRLELVSPTGERFAYPVNAWVRATETLTVHRQDQAPGMAPCSIAIDITEVQGPAQGCCLLLTFADLNGDAAGEGCMRPRPAMALDCL